MMDTISTNVVETDEFLCFYFILLTFIKVSLLNGMTEFRVGEVFLICRKIILIHGQGPGFCYLQVKRFK